MKYGKRLLIGTLLLTIFLANTAAPASAYVYNGIYWHSGYAQYCTHSTILNSWKPSLDAAANTWSNAGSNFYFSKTSCYNQLYYEAMSPNTLAANTYHPYNGDSITSCDTTFNANVVWSTSGEKNKVDVQSVATHEFGHWLSLGHSSNSDATMYNSVIMGDTKQRSLHSDDISGIQSIY